VTLFENIRSESAAKERFYHDETNEYPAVARHRHRRYPCGNFIVMVVDYGGGGDMNLAMENGELQCRAGTLSAYVGREPTRSWIKTSFVHVLVQSATKQ